MYSSRISRRFDLVGCIRRWAVNTMHSICRSFFSRRDFFGMMGYPESATRLERRLPTYVTDLFTESETRDEVLFMRECLKYDSFDQVFNLFRRDCSA